MEHEFVFGKWNGTEGNDESHIKYLGYFITVHGDTFKLMTSILYWGLSCRSTCRIVIFNSQNQYVGNYYVGGDDELPDKLEKGELIFFNHKRKDCDSKINTIVNLKNGLPKQFFLKCKGEFGDIYTFDSF